MSDRTHAVRIISNRLAAVARPLVPSEVRVENEDISHAAS